MESKMALKEEEDPEVEELQEKILELKRTKNTLVLVHNYQRPEIQEVADYIGSSLQLCWRASESQDINSILFCGVDFMAESAAILNPDKTVLIPDKNAKCPMAAMLPAEKVVEAKKRHPDAEVVLYVNTLAEAKAEADVMCTSSNAAKIVSKLDSKKILFGPDWNLAWHTQRHNPEKEIITIPDKGYCYVHKLYFGEEVLMRKRKHPDAELLVHPECDPHLQLKADFIGSTGQILNHCHQSNSKEYIIATETGLIHRLKKELPDKRCIPAMEESVCRQMKLHTLEKVYQSLKKKKHIVKVPRDIADKARRGIQRMLELSA
ncbi:MAG: quinolinate synthase NadA [Thermoproteota archaeon]